MLLCSNLLFFSTLSSDSPLFPRFRVNVQVADDTESTTVVLFNAVTERMLDVSAKKLINKMPPGDDSVPSELQPLLGKELVFKLKLNKYNSVDGLQDYGVSAVYTHVGELESANAYYVLAAVSTLLCPVHLHPSEKHMSAFTCFLLSFFRPVLIWWSLELMMTMFRKVTPSERGSSQMLLKTSVKVAVRRLNKRPTPFALSN